MVFDEDDRNPYEFIWFLTMMIAIPMNLYGFIAKNNLKKGPDPRFVLHFLMISYTFLYNPIYVVLKPYILFIKYVWVSFNLGVF